MHSLHAFIVDVLTYSWLSFLSFFTVVSH